MNTYEIILVTNLDANDLEEADECMEEVLTNCGLDAEIISIKELTYRKLIDGKEFIR